jgi:predicted nucleotide-binding protein (sugar kinase/HSP70/actin superfamily)
MFWTHGRKIIGSAFSLIENNNIDGIIYLSSFGCGLDSVLVHLVSKSAVERKIPLIVMTLDEQTGEAGFNTRLEAFLDMIEWRVKDENNISAFR